MGICNAKIGNKKTMYENLVRMNKIKDRADIRRIYDGLDSEKSLGEGISGKVWSLQIGLKFGLS